jgi:hypothetical protein
MANNSPCLATLWVDSTMDVLIIFANSGQKAVTRKAFRG